MWNPTSPRSLWLVLSALGSVLGSGAGAQAPEYRLRIAPADPVVSEDAGELVIVVSVAGCDRPRNDVVWEVTADGGPAPAAEPGVDFGAVAPSEITLGRSSGREEVRLPVTQDDEPDPDEAVVLTLRARGDPALACAEGALLPANEGTETVTILIADDEVPEDAPPEISVGHAIVGEGDAGVARLEFPVRISPPSRREVSVLAQTRDGTATANEDYRPFSGRIRFPPGSEEKLVAVPVLGDGVEEENETLLLEISEPVNAVLGNDLGDGLIEDDDAMTDLVLDTVGSTDRLARPGEVVVLQVRVTTDGGSAASAVGVVWSLSTDSDATLLDGATTMTDAAGIATQRVRAGSNPGVSSLVASDDGGARRVAFTVTVGDDPGS